MDNRATWSAAGGIVTVCCASDAVVWIAAASVPHSGLPTWPGLAFGAVAVLGLYCVFAPLLRLWPFRGFGSVGELLDTCIREGREMRDMLTEHPRGRWGIAYESGEWTLRTAHRLHVGFPAIADAFILAIPPEDSPHTGFRLDVERINIKLEVLAAARRGLGA